MAVTLGFLGRHSAPEGGQPAHGDTVDATTVRTPVPALHAALAAGDSSQALDLLHPDVRVFEGGDAETLSQYRSGHLSVDMEFSAAVERKALDDQMFGGEARVVYLSEYHMAGTFRGEDVEARGTETMILVRTADGWRIRHIHWSSR